MLAELVAANAAFAIIKSAVQNTGDLTKVAHRIAEYSVQNNPLRDKPVKIGQRVNQDQT